jgi:hypothetical protein
LAGRARWIAGGLVVAWIAGRAGVAVAAKEKPPLVERLEEATGLELTFNQREKIAELSREHARELRAMHAAFLANISKVVGLSQKVLREEVFPEMSPSFDIDEAHCDKIERLTDGFLPLPEKRALKEIEATWGARCVEADNEAAKGIAAVTDLPTEDVQEFLTASERTRR